VPWPVPIASRPSQMKSPRPNAQRKDVIPREEWVGDCRGGVALGAGEPPGSPEPPPLVRYADERFALDQKKFAEPVSLSSTASADFPLPSCDGPVLPSDSVSTYLRSVLGAIRKLRNARRTIKGSKEVMAAICGFFLFQYFHSFSCSCG